MRISLLKIIVGLALLYYGLKTLHLLPIEVINFVEGVVGGLLGNLWGVVLVLVGIMLLLGSTYSRSRVKTRYYKTWGTLSDDEEERP